MLILPFITLRDELRSKPKEQATFFCSAGECILAWGRKRYERYTHRDNQRSWYSSGFGSNGDAGEPLDRRQSNIWITCNNSCGHDPQQASYQSKGCFRSKTKQHLDYGLQFMRDSVLQFMRS
ncbi:hypothetical protein AAC387_Pa04g2669 [Persea americana]